MVTAVHFIATAADHMAMLDYLGEPNAVTVHPWPVVSTPAETWTREQALAARQVLGARALGRGRTPRELARIPIGLEVGERR